MRSAVTMLSQPYSLADVEDLESLCRTVVERLLRSTGAHWQWAEIEDAVQELMVQAWLLHEHRYDPTRGLPFASYASWKLRCWAIDTFFRAELGRKGDRARREDSLEELVERGELDRTVPPRSGDEPFDRVLARTGLRPGGDREDLRRACAEVAELARRPKGVSSLLRELRAEIEAQVAA